MRALHHSRSRCSLLLLIPVALSCNSPVRSQDFATEARQCAKHLAARVMPYWYDTAIDRTNGGYLLSDVAGRTTAPATEKQLVSQARMVWGFSRAHLRGLSDGRRNYLKAAEQGYRFLTGHFRDTANGGYFWSTDLEGRPVNRRKIIYGESFVIYGLVEYYRASGDKAALRDALDLFDTLEKHSHDSRNLGWVEHFTENWTPLLTPSPEAIVEVAGFKSANTHLHLMEALAELYDATRDSRVKKRLVEALDLNMKYFYPANPGASCFHRQLDWKPVTAKTSAGLSYGHNVEFAWLMVRAQQVLGRKPSWAHFEAHVDHALRYGYDHARGGLYSRGFDDQPATDTEKIWWVQSEMLAALTDGLQHSGVQEGVSKDKRSTRQGDRIKAQEYAEALRKLLDFVHNFQTDPRTGIWMDTVTAEGKPKSPALAHNWKANYHDVRGMLKFIEAFAPESLPQRLPSSH